MTQPIPDDPLDSLFDAVERELDKKADAKAIEEAREVHEMIPDELKPFINEHTLVTPSKRKANPKMDLMVKYVEAMEKVRELADLYDEMQHVMSAMIQTYGYKVDGGYAIYVSDEMLMSQPKCIDMQGQEDTVTSGQIISTRPHECEITPN